MVEYRWTVLEKSNVIGTNRRLATLVVVADRSICQRNPPPWNKRGDARFVADEGRVKYASANVFEK